MEFYEQLSRYYDDIFLLENEILEFLFSYVNGEVLDVACGTGTYTNALAKKGAKITGIDISESMIRQAEIKKDEIYNANFIIKDMMDLKDLKKNDYKFVYCIGNSIVHLDGKAEISLLIRDMKEKMRTGGKLVLQIINFDRIFKNNLKKLPSIKNEAKQIILERQYSYNNKERIEFITKLKIYKDNQYETYKNKVGLYPILFKELDSIIQEQKFKKIEYFGDYRKNLYNEDSFLLIAVLTA